MTRLKKTDIENIDDSLLVYEKQLKKICGFSLWEIACHAAKLPKDSIFENKIKPINIHVVPVKSGLGIISGFTETVRSIISHLGFKATCTKTSDVAGLAEAIENGTDLVFMADDDRFVAFYLNKQQIFDNTPATAKGFISALDLMVKGIQTKTVLVLGCGPVGFNAAIAANDLGAQIAVFDIDPSKSLSMVEWFQKNRAKEIQLETDIDQALQNHLLVFDATPAADIISKDHFQPDTLIVAPGMPCGITRDAMIQYPLQFLHDPLQLGIATMLALAIREINIGSSSFCIGNNNSKHNSF
jgi:3-methylornithyl-N6-L-lysine dehydrogenase